MRDGAPESLVQGQGPLANDAPDNQLGINEAVKADPKRAMIEAMANQQFKPLQAIGQAEFAGMGKEKMTQKDIYGLAANYTPESVNAYAQTGDPTKLVGKVKLMGVNGQAIDEQTGIVKADLRDKYEAPANLPGPNGMPVPVGGQCYGMTPMGPAYGQACY